MPVQHLRLLQQLACLTCLPLLISPGPKRCGRTCEQLRGADGRTPGAGVGEAMDPSTSDASIEAGARLEAPLWLAAPLAAQQMATLR